MTSSRMIRRMGMTLIEILIAMTMTLVVLGAMMVAFNYAGIEIAKGRAMIEMSNQLRVAQETMRSDLEGVTVDMRPWAITAGPNGYFEYIEGIRSDVTSGIGSDSVLGDVDDIIAMTVRGNGRTFHGRGPNGDVTSDIAEVVWWSDYVDRDGDSIVDYDESISVYRRQLLIVPGAPTPATTINDVINYFRQNDISARWVDTDGDGTKDTLVPNSLEDLAKRENRFCHWPVSGLPYSYPYLLDRWALAQCEMSTANMAGFDLRFAGNDVVISDVLGFDVQVFSPNTPIQENNGIAVGPSDPGYDFTGFGVVPVAAGVDSGAFVDLGYEKTPPPYPTRLFDPARPEYSTLPVLKLGLPPTQSGLIYVNPSGDCVGICLDTFSKHYESNGIDDDFDGLIDEGTNGLDDDGINGVDDNGERETIPPYPYRISGIKVSFRVVERNTRQIRQTSVVHSFMPQ